MDLFLADLTFTTVADVIWCQWDILLTAPANRLAVGTELNNTSWSTSR